MLTGRSGEQTPPALDPSGGQIPERMEGRRKLEERWHEGTDGTGRER